MKVASYDEVFQLLHYLDIFTPIIEDRRKLSFMSSNDFLGPIVVVFVITLLILFTFDILESKSLFESSPAQSLLSDPRYLLSAAFDIGGTGFVLLEDDNDINDDCNHRRHTEEPNSASEVTSQVSPSPRTENAFIGSSAFTFDSLAKKDALYTQSRQDKWQRTQKVENTRTVPTAGSPDSAKSSPDGRKFSASGSSSSNSSGVSSSVFSALHTIDEQENVGGGSGILDYALAYPGHPRRRSGSNQYKVKVSTVKLRDTFQERGQDSDSELLSDILHELGVDSVTEFGTSDTEHEQSVARSGSGGLRTYSREHPKCDEGSDPADYPAQGGTGIVHVVRERQRHPVAVGVLSEELTSDIRTILHVSEVISNAIKYHNGNLESCDTVSRLHESASTLPKSSLLATAGRRTYRSQGGDSGLRVDTDDDIHLELDRSHPPSPRRLDVNRTVSYSTSMTSGHAVMLEQVPSSQNQWSRLVLLAGVYKKHISPYISAILRNHRYIRPFTYASMHQPRTLRFFDLVATLLCHLLITGLVLSYIQYHYSATLPYCNDFTTRVDCDNSDKDDSPLVYIAMLAGEGTVTCVWDTTTATCEPWHHLCPYFGPGHIEAFIYYLILATVIVMISALPRAVFNFLFATISGKLPNFVDFPCWQHIVIILTDTVAALCCVKSNREQLRWGEVNKINDGLQETPVVPLVINTSEVPQIPKRVSEWSMSVARRNVTKYAYCDFVTPAEEARVVYTSVRDYFMRERDRQVLPWRSADEHVDVIASSEASLTSGVAASTGHRVSDGKSVLEALQASADTLETSDDAKSIRSSSIEGNTKENRTVSHVSGPYTKINSTPAKAGSVREVASATGYPDGTTRCESIMQNLFVYWDATPEELTYFQKFRFRFSHKVFTEWRIRMARLKCDDIVSRMMGYAGVAVRDSHAAYETLRNEADDEGEHESPDLFDKRIWSQSPFAHGHKFCMQLVLLQSAIVEQLPTLGVSQGRLFGQDFGLQRLATLRAMFQYDGYASARISSLWWCVVWTIILGLLSLCAYISIGIFEYGNDYDTNSSWIKPVTADDIFRNENIVVTLFIFVCILDCVVLCMYICLVDVLVLESTKPSMQKIYHVFSNILKTMRIYSGGKAACLHGYIRLVQHLSPSCRAARCSLSNGLSVAEMLLCLDDQDIALCRSRVTHSRRPSLAAFLLAIPAGAAELLMHMFVSGAYNDTLWMVTFEAAVAIVFPFMLFLVMYAFCCLYIAGGALCVILVIVGVLLLAICFYVFNYIRGLSASTPSLFTGEEWYHNTPDTARRRELIRQYKHLKCESNASPLVSFLMECLHHERAESRGVRALLPFMTSGECDSHTDVIWRNMNMISATMLSRVGIAAAPVRQLIEDDESSSPFSSFSNSSVEDTPGGVLLSVANKPSKQLNKGYFIPEEIVNMFVGSEYDKEIAYVQRTVNMSFSLMDQIQRGSSRGLLGSSRSLLGDSNRSLSRMVSRAVSKAGTTDANHSNHKGARLMEMTSTSKQLSSIENADAPTHTAAHDANSLRMIQLLSKQRIYRATNNIDVSVMRAKRVFKQISTECEGTVIVKMMISDPNHIKDIAGIAVGSQVALPISPRTGNDSQDIVYFLLDDTGLRRVLEVALSSYRPEGVPLSLSEIAYFFDQLHHYISKMRQDLAEFEDDNDDTNSFCSDTGPCEDDPIPPPQFYIPTHRQVGSSGGSSKDKQHTTSTLDSINEHDGLEVSRKDSRVVSHSTPKRVTESGNKDQKPSRHANLLYDRFGRLLCVEMYHFLGWYKQMCLELIATRHTDELNKQQRDEMLSRTLPVFFGRNKARFQHGAKPVVPPLETLAHNSPRRPHENIDASPRKRSRQSGSLVSFFGGRSSSYSQSTSQKSSEKSSLSMSSFFRSPVGKSRSNDTSTSHSQAQSQSLHSSNSYDGDDHQRNVSVPYSKVFVSRKSSSGSSVDSVYVPHIRRKSPKHKEVSRSSPESSVKPERRGLVIDQPGSFSHSPEKLLNLYAASPTIDMVSEGSRRFFSADSGTAADKGNEKNASPGKDISSSRGDRYELPQTDSMHSAANTSCAVMSFSELLQNDATPTRTPGDRSGLSDIDGVDHLLTGDESDSSGDESKDGNVSSTSETGDLAENTSTSTVDVSPRHRKAAVHTRPGKHPPRPLNKRKGR